MTPLEKYNDAKNRENKCMDAARKLRDDHADDWRAEHQEAWDKINTDSIKARRDVEDAEKEIKKNKPDFDNFFGDADDFADRDDPTVNNGGRSGGGNRNLILPGSTLRLRFTPPDGISAKGADIGISPR